MTYELPFDDAYEPYHASSPTDRVILELQMYGHRPNQDEPDPRPLPDDETLTIGPGRRAMVPCGFAFALPQGYEAQIRPRSGLAAKYGVTVLNSPGTVDADYRGEVKVLLINLGDETFEVRRGDRIAQMIVAPVSSVRLVVSDALDQTERGPGGYGSTGR